MFVFFIRLLLCWQLKKLAHLKKRPHTIHNAQFFNIILYMTAATSCMKFNKEKKLLDLLDHLYNLRAVASR